MPHGILDVVVANARQLRDKDVFGKMDPFIDLVVDSQRFRTKTATGGGRNPAFNQTFRFNILEGCKFLQVEVWDEDAVNNDHIGSCRVPLDKAFTTGIDDQWFELVTRSGKSAGQVHMCLNFVPRATIQQPGAKPAGQPAVVQPPAQGGAYYPPQPQQQQPQQPLYAQHPPTAAYPAQFAAVPYPAQTPPPQAAYAPHPYPVMQPVQPYPVMQQPPQPYPVASVPSYSPPPGSQYYPAPPQMAPSQMPNYLPQMPAVYSPQPQPQPQPLMMPGAQPMYPPVDPTKAGHPPTGQFPAYASGVPMQQQYPGYPGNGQYPPRPPGM